MDEILDVDFKKGDYNPNDTPTREYSKNQKQKRMETTFDKNSSKRFNSKINKPDKTTKRLGFQGV